MEEGGGISSMGGRSAETTARELIREFYNTAEFPALAERNFAVESEYAAQRQAPGSLVLRQRFDNIPVFEGRFEITYDAQGRVLMMTSGGLLHRVPSETQPRIGVEEAILTAMESVGLSRPASPLNLIRERSFLEYENPLGPYNPIAADQWIFPLDRNRGLPAWRILLEAGESRYFEIVVDALEGAVLLRRNLHTQAGTARVWLESPSKGARELVRMPDSWLAPGNRLPPAIMWMPIWMRMATTSPTFAIRRRCATGAP
jgi:hypothetical protein